MRKFKLYVYNKRYSRLITSFDNTNPTDHIEPFSTYDEKLTEAENDQFNLDFKMVGWVTINGVNQRNYWLDILKIGSRIRIEIDDNVEIRLIITNIQPTPSINNIIYQFSAQDEISYLWAKHNLGYSYSTVELGSVQNIYTIANNILKDNHLNLQWKVIDEEPLDLSRNSLRDKLITLEVENSNPYNILIEACNTLDCLMRVNYKRQTISFYQKQYIQFSGYRYRPESNLQSFSASYESSDFTTLMHITGGENEYGEIITLVPAIPTAVQTYILEQWAKDSNLDNRFEWKDNYPPTTIDWIIINNNIINEEQNNPNKYYITNLEDQEARENELQEIANFCNIANQVPHLGQFLLNFDYFKNAHLMTETEYNNLIDIFNQQMRNNNLWLKIYTPVKYQIEWLVMEKLNEIFNEGSEYQAECQYIQQRISSSENANMNAYTSYEELIQSIPEIEEKIVNSCITNNFELFRNLVMLYGSSATLFTRKNGEYDASIYPNIQEYIDQRQYYIDKSKAAEQEIKNIENQLKSITDTNSPIYIELSQKLALLEQNKTTYDTLGSGWYITTANGEQHRVMGLYEFLLEIMYEQYLIGYSSGVYNNLININTILNYYQEQNNDLWRTVYNEYGDFIYESQYENTDELDSVSLFNQGVLSFEKRKSPIPDYSLTTLDLGMLEPIGIPKLAIGSKIKIYNKFLSLNDNSLDNISYNDNELIVTELSYDLRNAAKINISVEKIQTYESIIEKLLLSVKK